MPQPPLPFALRSIEPVDRAPLIRKDLLQISRFNLFQQDDLYASAVTIKQTMQNIVRMVLLVAAFAILGSVFTRWFSAQ